MNIDETSIQGVYLLTPIPHHDERGWFSRTFDGDLLRAHGLCAEFVQGNQSRSRRGVIRGLHLRVGRGEAKLFRCARGAVFEAVVDVRPWSPTYGHVEIFTIDDVAMQQIYLPPGIAHGFQVLSEFADLCYQHSESFVAEDNLAIAWNDATLEIRWPLDDATLSEQDRRALPFLDPKIQEILGEMTRPE